MKKILGLILSVVGLGSVSAVGGVFESAREYVDHIFKGAKNTRSYVRARLNAIQLAKTKEDAYDCGFHEGVRTATDEHFFGMYQECQGKLDQVVRHDQDINELKSKDLHARLFAAEAELQKIGDGQRLVGMLLSLKGGVTLVSAGVLANFGGQMISAFVPAFICNQIIGGSTTLFGLGVAALTVQTACVLPEKLAQKGFEAHGKKGKIAGYIGGYAIPVIGAGLAAYCLSKHKAA